MVNRVATVCVELLSSREFPLAWYPFSITIASEELLLHGAATCNFFGQKVCVSLKWMTFLMYFFGARVETDES